MRRAGLRSGPGLLLAPLVLVAAVVVAWQLYVDSSGIAATTLPSPGRVLRQGWLFRSLLWHNTVPTLEETAIGFGISLASAWIIATLLDFSRLARQGLYPLLVVSQTIPIVAIAPLLIIWFGFGLLPKVLVVALSTFFPIAVTLAEGFAATDEDAMRLMRSFGAGRWRAFRSVRVPSALPFFFAGLRVGITYAVVGAVFAEYVGAQSGLGIFMQEQKNAFRTDLVLAAVLVTAVLSITLFVSTYAVQWLVMPWRRRSRG